MAANVPTNSFGFTSGALLRRGMRRAMMTFGLEFKEDKGLLDSYFVVSGPQDKLRQFYEWASQYADEA